jgi:hypothetical protein
MHLMDILRNEVVWGVLLALIGVISVFVHRGETLSQRRAHRIFRQLLVLSCLNFAFACNPGSFKKLEIASPQINHFLIRWLIASIFLIPAFAFAEIAMMWHTKSPEKTPALVTDCSLAAAYVIMVVGALMIAAMGVPA